MSMALERRHGAEKGGGSTAMRTIAVVRALNYVLSMFDICENRALLAYHLWGEGIEFGALDGPLRLPPYARARYADHMSNEQLAEKYPNLNPIPVDIVLKGADLSEIPDESQDFLIANHVIEHLPNPIGALRVWERKLKKNGAIYLSYPIPEFCCDNGRPNTSIEHLIADDKRSTSNSSHEHLLAFVLHWNPSAFPEPENIRDVLKVMWSEGRETLKPTDRISDANKAKVAEICEKDNIEIHHHMFTLETLLASVKAATNELQPFDISGFRGLFNEVIVVFRKTHASPELDRAFLAAKIREECISQVIADRENGVREWAKIADDRLAIIEARQT